MNAVEQEYFSDLGFSMTGTQVRPDVKNIQSYSKAQKLKHTPAQLVSQSITFIMDRFMNIATSNSRIINQSLSVFWQVMVFHDQIAMIFLAIISILLIFLTFLNPRESFGLESLFDNILSIPTWTENRTILANNYINSPFLNWKSILTSDDFYHWFGVRIIDVWFVIYNVWLI